MAYDPQRDPYGIGSRLSAKRDRRGTYLANGDWQRLAAGQPIATEARALRDAADREFWLALLAGEVSLVEARDYPDRLAGDETVVLALPPTRYRRTWASIDTLAATRGEETLPLWEDDWLLRWVGGSRR